MKTVLIIVLLLVPLCAVAFAQQFDMQMKMEPAEKPVALLSGLGSWHHPTSTRNPEAQSCFDPCGDETERRRSLSLSA